MKGDKEIQPSLSNKACVNLWQAKVRKNTQILSISDNVHIYVRKTWEYGERMVETVNLPRHAFTVIKSNFNVCHNSKCHNFITLPTQS